VAKVNVSLKGTTTVDNPNDVDEGYQIEIAIDLKALGYPVGMGDGALFISATLFDGDEFANALDNYGTRVWWMRESDWPAGPAWAFMDKNALITGVAKPGVNGVPEAFALLGNYPNPFNPSTNIRYTVPLEGYVTIRVYNVLGREVLSMPVGLQAIGTHETSLDASALSSGVYFYRLEMTANASKKISMTGIQKMLLVK